MTGQEERELGADRPDPTDVLVGDDRRERDPDDHGDRSADHRDGDDAGDPTTNAGEESGDGTGSVPDDFEYVEELLADRLGEEDGTARDPPTVVSGVVRGIDRVQAALVPADHPVEVATTDAIELTVEVDGERVRTYVEWPETGDPDTQLARLLAPHGIALDSLGDLYGRTIPLARMEGEYVVYGAYDRARPEGAAAWWEYVLVASMLAWAGVVGVAQYTVGNPVVGIAAIVAWVLPLVAVYFDAKRVRARSTWDPITPLWMVGVLLPYVNLLAITAYLYRRNRTDFFGG